MKPDKIDLNNINNANLGQTVQQMQNAIPQGAVMLDKGLLPSRGKFYKNPIYVRKLKVLDIKNLSTINADNVNNVVNTVLQNCVFGIDYKDIQIGDKVWLVFYLRAFTYNDLPFRLRGECPECNTISNYNYQLRDLDVVYLAEDFKEEDMKLTLGNKDELVMTFPTVSTELSLNKLKNNDQIIEEINSELLELAGYLKSVNGRELSLLKAYEYITNMEPLDFSKFGNELMKYIFTARPQAKFKCPACGEEVTLQMAFVPAFFMPK